MSRRGERHHRNNYGQYSPDERRKGQVIRLCSSNVNLYKHLVDKKREYILSKQLLRSGTSVGANVAEANQAQSRPDFVSKLSIALKEAVETEYWLNLLRDSGFLTEREAVSVLADCQELIRILTASVKTTRKERL